MAQFLPEQPSFGQLFARGLGSGLSAGLGRSLDMAQQLALEKHKMNKRQQLVDALMGGSSAREPSAIERELSPQQVRSMADQLGGRQAAMEKDPFAAAKAAAISGEPELGRVFAEEARTAQKEKFAREKAAEPRLLDMEDRLKTLDQDAMRFGRLQELFSPELEEKFPSSLTTALFSKHGELRPTAAALLSPEAQEAVKLIADSLSGAKDTFGARVTNFDLQSYMKRLPSLLNTPEGRRRVLRDLQLMNEINRFHDEGVLDIVDRFGGPGKISLSKAERLFRKEYGPQLAELREEFVRPHKTEFSELPAAARYKGKRIQDEQTGQFFRSDGKEWIPE